ncbi:hypothetical protein BG015_007742 [Linnemannia schmuckeri]|uniref:Uncharacterized protein n=1 Tax=Linnemannia schmuckeri TaxID=64567 RepID=A0A9P5RYE5_9FUNG|nr:hypothetical protein BG015_007742 [Linnemannia schmuckeri]
MKSTLFLAVAALCAAAVIQPVTMATPVVESDASSSNVLEKRILEQCKNKTGVCVSKEACVGTGFNGKERRIDGLCDRKNDEFICCINF